MGRNIIVCEITNLTAISEARINLLLHMMPLSLNIIMDTDNFSHPLAQQPVTFQILIRKIALSNVVSIYLPLAGILLLGSAVRLYQINALGFNTDEAVYSGQAAAIAQIPSLRDFFPVFRAHPLLFQFIISLIFKIWGVDDLRPRLAAVAFGLATIFLVYQLGFLLYGHKTGLIAALFMAVMPYHVIVESTGLVRWPVSFLCHTDFLRVGKICFDGTAHLAVCHWDWDGADFSRQRNGDSPARFYLCLSGSFQ